MRSRFKQPPDARPAFSSRVPSEFRIGRRLFDFRAGLRALLTAFAASALLAGSALANPFEDTIGILEDRTVFRWGRDCLVWIVHYPEELVEPWVEAEAGRAGMTESEREAYRKSFVSELSIGAREPFLFTVYAFGPRPLSFAPIPEKVALVTSGGERFKPVRYDKALDQPVSGIVQGLIFFPKQRDREFAVAVQGMGVHDERLFSFGGSAPPAALAAESQESGAEVVVLELPPRPEPKKAAVPPSRGAAGKTPPRQPQPPKEIERPAPPVVPPPAPTAAGPNPAGPEEESMAEFVEALRAGDRRAPSAAQEPPAVREPGAERGPDTARGPESSDADSAYISREKTVRDFLSLWTQNDPAAMYAMLAESSRKLFSKETFESDLRKASDFRAALRGGYTLEWLGTERARVVAVKRVLLIRTLVSRTLGVVREGSAWKIVW